MATPFENLHAAATRFSLSRKMCVSSRVLGDMGATVASARAQLQGSNTGR
ncbi:MAG: hypothetical protein ABGY24_18390 [bacterium]